MPYCEAVIHESVRHFMGRTFGVPHRALRDTTLAGYYIPKVSWFNWSYKINRLDNTYKNKLKKSSLKFIIYFKSALIQNQCYM